MRPITLLVVALLGLAACSHAPDPRGRWTLDKSAARAAFDEAYRTNPAAKKVFDELKPPAGKTAVEAVVDSFSVTYDLLDNNVYNHTFKVTAEIPPHLKPTELQQTGTWTLNGTEISFQPKEQNGVAVGGAPNKSVLSYDTLSYSFMGVVTLQLRKL